MNGQQLQAYASLFGYLQNAQTAADAEAQAAAVRIKVLTKQQAEQKKTLATKDKEAGKLQAELTAAQSALSKATSRLEVRLEPELSSAAILAVPCNMEVD
jgi:hypothetical protein